MAIKVQGVETYGKKDALLFSPYDLIKAFSAYTGRVERSREQIDEKKKSLLLHGQESPFKYRKDKSTKEMILIDGHTRAIASYEISEEGLTDAKGFTYSREQPFLLYGIYQDLSEYQAIIASWVANADHSMPNDDDAADLIQTLSERFGRSDADIAKDLGKDAVWVSLRRKVIYLDPNTRLALRKHEISLDVAINGIANVKQEDRQAVVNLAKENNHGKVTLDAVSDAVQELNAKTVKPIKNSDTAFKNWVKETAQLLSAGPAQSFLWAILDVRAGVSTFTELTEKFAKATGESIETKTQTTAA